MKLRFILADRFVTYCSIVHENSFVPCRKRVVTIELTPEQETAVKPREVGTSGTTTMYEDLLEVFVDNEGVR